MSIELTTATIGLRGDIAATLPSYDVVATLPELILDGRIKLFNGTLWRGLLAGESSLPAGTPWPVKGYKEYTATLQGGNDQSPTAIVHNNDLDGTVVWTREQTGIYVGTLSDAFPSGRKSIEAIKSILYDPELDVNMKIYSENENTIVIMIYNIAQDAIDYTLSGVFVEMKIYP